MGGRSILISGVTEQHKRACDSFNLCLLVMASARLIKGRALRWQVQGVASAFASACACLGVVIASIDTMRLRHRCGFVVASSIRRACICHPQPFSADRVPHARRGLHLSWRLQALCKSNTSLDASRAWLLRRMPGCASQIQRLAPGAADPQVKVKTHVIVMKDEGAAEKVDDARADF